LPFTFNLIVLKKWRQKTLILPPFYIIIIFLLKILMPTLIYTPKFLIY